MDNRSPSMLMPALIGGSVFGFVGGLPVLGALNCACCALVVASGFLASYLYSGASKNAGVEFNPGKGALVGLISGLFYAVATTITSGLVHTVFPQDLGGLVEKLQEFEGEGIPPEVVDAIARFTESSGSLIGLVVGLFVSLLLGVIFATLGGLIGGAVFKVEPRPPVSPSAG